MGTSANPTEADAAAAAYSKEVGEYAKMAARREAELGSWQRSYTELDPRSQLCIDSRLHEAACYRGVDGPAFHFHNPYLHPSFAREYHARLAQDTGSVGATGPTAEDMKE